MIELRMVENIMGRKALRILVLFFTLLLLTACSNEEIPFGAYEASDMMPYETKMDLSVVENLAFSAVRSNYDSYRVSLLSVNTDDLAAGVVTYEFELINEGFFADRIGIVKVVCRSTEGTESWDISIENESFTTNRKYEAILGTWEANWAVGSFDGFHFYINITDVDDTSIRASGNLHTPGITHIQSAADRPFDGVFVYEVDDSNGEVRIVVNSFQWWGSSTVRLTVLFDANNVYYFGFNTFSDGAGLNYNNRVMLTKTMDAAVPEDTAAIDVIVSNENELRSAINQVGTIATVERPPATITLASDIELISDFIIPTGVDVTLRGLNNNVFSLISTRDMDVITIVEGSKLTLENINISRVSGTRGSGIIAERNTELIMHSGTISGHTGTEQDRSGGVDSYGTFVMNGGTIKGNSPGGFWVKGDVHVCGSFTMNGGTIGGDENGGLSNSGSFVMNNGSVHGGYSTASWGRSGNASVTMNGGTIDGDVSYQASSNPFVITNGTIRGNMSGGNLSGNLEMSGGTIYGDVQLARITLHNGDIVGRVISYGNVGSFFIMNGGSIRDSEGDGVSVGRSSLTPSITINGGTISGHAGRGINLNAGGANLTINGGTITGNNGGVSQVASQWFSAGSGFIMNGGSIHGNNTSGSGGGIDTAGVFTMNGGTVHNNAAEGNGGGVNQTDGTFTFEGGWIYNNNASNGDDIQIGQSGTFNNNVFDTNIGAIGSPPP